MKWLHKCIIRIKFQHVGVDFRKLIDAEHIWLLSDSAQESKEPKPTQLSHKRGKNCVFMAEVENYLHLFHAGLFNYNSIASAVFSFSI